MNEITSKLSEKVHYEIIPSAENPHGWDIRLLEEYPETVISFGAIEFSGVDGDDGHISFNFDVVSSPEDITEDDLTFQEYVGRILSSIIEMSIAEGTMVAQDQKTGETLMTEQMSEELEESYNEYKFGTDDSEESINE